MLRADFHSLDGFDHEFIQTRASLGDVIDELLRHPAFPKSLDMIQNACYRRFPREIREVERDLIRVVNHEVDRWKASFTVLTNPASFNL